MTDGEVAGQPSESLPEAELVESPLQGDGERVWKNHQELFEAENPALLRATRRMLQAYDLPSHLAEDLVQEAWADLIANWDSVRLPIAWIYTVVRRKVHREMQRPAIWSSDGDLETAEINAEWTSLQHPAVDAHDAYALSRALEAVDDLPERQRTALLLFGLSDRSEAEVAAIMGISRGTVGATVHKARNNLRARLGKFGTFGFVAAMLARGRAILGKRKPDFSGPDRPGTSRNAAPERGEAAMAALRRKARQYNERTYAQHAVDHLYNEGDPLWAYFVEILERPLPDDMPEADRRLFADMEISQARNCPRCRAKLPEYLARHFPGLGYERGIW
ncbi:sigma-70 family RNA polymerase sigma factor [Actinospica durhamensis]|uniref:Sigma-70 family RNA polymerase sigma factor n=1 Tax=Actinospica durhamensis TaxID=1508375 RepID=A0A941EYL3_9ACTN|nr:sigma-70 family RNA polymerase sigma factor [Actinospica durhamensis]MBR7839686.1 sigma-70 family RNA polymerase sigma factor [Actinospica durhamensis]